MTGLMVSRHKAQRSTEGKMQLQNLNTLDERRALQAFKSDLSREIALRREFVSNYELSVLYALAPMVYAATEFWGSNVEGVPFRAYSKDSDELIDDESHPIVQMLADPQFRYQMGRTERTMRTWGYSMSRKRKNLWGDTVGLQWVNPNLYVLDRRGAGMTLLGFRVFSGRGQEIPTNYIKRQDAVFFHEFSFYDDYDGVSSAEAAFRAAATEPEMQTMMLSLFRNMAVPLSIIQPEKDATAGEFKEGELNRLKTFIQSFFRGARNFGRTFVTSARWTWQNISIPFKDMELSTHYQPMRESVAQAYDVKLAFFTTGEARHDELDAMIQLWYRQSLSPRCEKYGVTLTEQLCAEYPDVVIRPDLSEILTEDQAAKLENIEKQQKLSLITLGEAMQLNGQEPDPLTKDLLWYDGVGWIPKSEFRDAWKLRISSTAPDNPTSPLALTAPPDTTPTKPEQPDAAQSAYVDEDTYKEIEVATRKAAKSLPFTPVKLDAATVARIQVLAEFGIDRAEIIQAAKSHHLSVSAAKALATTRSRFESELARQMTAAFNEKIKRGTFVSRMMTLLTRYARLAYADGYSDAGSEIDLDDSEDDESVDATAWLDDFVGEQRQYIENIADVIYEDDILTEEEIRTQKGTLWWNKSVLPAYNHSLALASKNARLEWRIGDCEDHCPSCLALNGIVLTAKRWAKEAENGCEPGSKSLACWGGHCCCGLFPTNKKKHRGALPQWKFSEAA
jgi:phage portal protein BeeE